MKSEHYSVAVVGGGPAGASCAISLLNSGASSVALIDKARFPRDKSCGDGIGPGAVLVMHRLGLGDRLKSHVPIRFFSVSAPSGLAIKGPLPTVGGKVQVGYTIPRKKFDHYLAQAALERGAADLTGERVEQASFAAGRWVLRLKRLESGDPHSITADVVVGADGARSKIRRALNVPMNSDVNTGIAVRLYARPRGVYFDALQIDLVKRLLPGYGWLFPIGSDRANIGVGIDVANYKRQEAHLGRLLDDYRQRLADELDCDETSSLSSILPYASELPRLAHPEARAALIGDAGSMINPLTGEGIFYGMFAGELLGRLLAKAARRADAGGCESALAEYENRFRRRFERHFHLNWRLKQWAASERWCDRVIHACGQDEVVLSALIDLTMGERKSVGLGTVIRVLRRNFLPFRPNKSLTGITHYS
jgi:geranylgeranyl reductase family protein